MVVQPMFASGINVDPGSAGTQLDHAQNGVPMLNIAAPNAGGMSHNKFKDYNVDPRGLILNNSNKTGVSTLGGALLQNPNLSSAEASLILNEVTGVSRSSLNGFTEVFGRRADLVVANPNGITCNGCGFINTGRTTLSTGTPQIQNGFLKGFDINGGDVNIEGNGLNAENINYFEIISRTAKIQAQINAQNLNIVTGRNNYNYETKEVTAKVDNGQSKPELAIEATSLGSIYAGQIRMVSTENGVGVNAGNYMSANSGNIQIDSNGNITTKDVISSNNVNLNAKDKVTTTGNNGAYGNININAKDVEVKSDSTVLSYSDVGINASNNITNEGNIEAINILNLNATDSVNNYGELESEKDINIATKTVSNSGNINAKESITVDSVNLVNVGTVNGKTTTINSNLTNSNTISGSNVFVNGEITNTGTLHGYNLLNIKSNYIDNTNGEFIAGIVNQNADGKYDAITEFGDLNVDFTGGHLDLTGKYFATDTIDIKADIITNNTEIKSLFDISFNTNGNFINNGQIIAGAYEHPDFINGWVSFGTLNINAGDITNNDILYASYLLNLDSKNNITNNQSLFSDYDLILKATNDIVNYGSILSDNSLTVTDARTLTNMLPVSEIYSNLADTNITIREGLTNKGFIKSGNDLIVKVGNETTSANLVNDFVFRAENKLDITASNNITNNYALISQNELNLNAGNQIYNGRDKFIFSLGAMTLTSGNSIINDAGVIKTESGDITITTKTYENKSYLTWSKDKASFIDIRLAPSAAMYPEGVHTYFLPYDRIKKAADDEKQQIIDYGLSTSTIVYSIDSTTDGDPDNSWRVLGEEYLTNGEYFNLNGYSRLESGADLVINARNVINDTSDITAANDIVMNIEHGGSVINTTHSDEVALRRILVRKDFDKDHADEGIDLYLGRQDFDQFMILKDDTEFTSAGDAINLLLNGQNKTLVKKHNNHLWDDEFVEFSYFELLMTYIDTKKEDVTGIKAISSKKGQILAGGNITMQEQGTGNSGGFSKDTSTGVEQKNLNSNPAQGLTEEEKNKKNSNLFYTDVSGDVNTPYVVSTVPINTEPKVDGIFFKYAGSNAGYLVETNPLFISTEKLMTSDYFLEKVGLTRDQFNIKFMGDAYWEKEYISKQIQNSFNRRFITGDIYNDAQQREVLLGNAEEVVEDLKLSLGIALSKEQIEKLKKPIVWYVEEERVVNGVKTKALIPKVYAPLHANFEIKDLGEGGVLAANNIDVKTKKDVLVAGLIKADGTTVINAGNLELAEADIVTENLNLDIENDVNIHGRSYSEHEQYGDENGFLNAKKRSYYNGTNIVAGNVDAKAKNFTMIGSDLTADNASFDIKENMTLMSVEETEDSWSHIAQGSEKSDRNITDMMSLVKQKSSTLNVKNNLYAKVGNDFNLIASDASADTATIDAGGNINLLSALEENYSEHKEFRKTILTRETKETTNYQGTNKGSTITVGTSLNASAGKDINMIASNITTKEEGKGDISLEAENVNMLSANDIEQNTDYYKKETISIWGAIAGAFKGLGTLVTKGKMEVNMAEYKEDTKVDRSETAKGSSISGANVKIKTKQDLNMQASTIAASNDVNVDAGRNVNMLSAEQLATSSVQQKDGKVYASVNVTKSSVSAEAGVKYTAHNEDSSALTHVGSLITAGNNATVIAKNDVILHGSDITAGNNTTVKAIDGSVKGYDVEDKYEHSESTIDVKTGVRAGITYNPAAYVEGAYNAGKSAVQGVGALASGDMTGVMGNFNSGMSGMEQANGAYSAIDNSSNALTSRNVTGINYFFDANIQKISQGSTVSKGSSITAGNHLTVETGKDLVLYGSVMGANTADVTVGGDMDIRSKYDTSTYSETNASFGMSAGTGFSAYAQASGTRASSAWVNNQAGIYTGSGSNINVKGHTNLEGAVLNDDSGNLNFSTKTISYSDMKGYDKSTTIGFGQNRGFEIEQQGEKEKAGAGSTYVKYGMHDVEQTNRATIGKGNITIGDPENSQDLAGLNRDIDKSQEITKNKKVETFEGNIDNRWFSEKGREEMANELTQFAKNVSDTPKKVADKISSVTARMFESTQKIKDPVEKQKAEKGVVFYQEVMIDKIKEAAVDENGKPRKLSEQEIETIQNSLSDPNVQAGIQTFANFDPNKSIKENAQTLVQQTIVDPNTGETKTIVNERLKNALANNADDFTLSYLVNESLWDAASNFNKNPTQLIAKTFGITVEKREMINPVPGGTVRCDAGGCGNYGDPRNGYSHTGVDVVAPVGQKIMADQDGEVQRIGNTTSGNYDSKLVIIQNDNLQSKIMYLDKDSLQVEEKVKVEQGDIVGKLIDVNNVYLNKKVTEYNQNNQTTNGLKNYINNNYIDISPHLHFETSTHNPADSSNNWTRTNPNDNLLLQINNTRQYQFLNTGITKQQFINNME